MSQPKAGKQLRILLAEDSEYVRELLVRFLTKKGHQVVAVVSAEDALQELRLGSFDVLLTDYRLPAMTGAELIRSQQSSDGLKFILISGELPGIETGELAGLRIDARLSKPLDLATLSKALTY